MDADGCQLQHSAECQTTGQHITQPESTEGRSTILNPALADCQYTILPENITVSNSDSLFHFKS